MEGDNPDAIDEAVRTLTTASHKLAEEMYKKTSGGAGTDNAGTGPNGQGSGSTDSAKSDEKVVDAEFEEVDKDKK
jgi:molecular chaperone DnaK